MMLAEFTANVGAYDFGLWIFCLFALLGALNQGAGLIDRFRPHPSVVPQPLETKEVKEPVSAGSYITHCRLNREEHGRIERDLKRKVEGVEAKHNELAREVSGLSATLESNGVQLIQMNQKVDRLLERFGLVHTQRP